MYRKIRNILLLPYHALWALGSALWYRFPAKKLTVIVITGTKGKSSVAEITNAILEKNGHRTALAGTIRFKIGDSSTPNVFKMTMPGRGYLQKFLHEAVSKKCTHAILEVTSEGTKQFRHWCLYPDVVVVTNISKEHIESHGSMERYIAAKLRIARAVISSPKEKRCLIVRKDNPYTAPFFMIPAEEVRPFSLTDAKDIACFDDHISFTWQNETYTAPLVGTWSVANCLASLEATSFLGVAHDIAKRALLTLPVIQGRAEKIDCGQSFFAIVDYAHTPDSLEALYTSFPHHRKICVLGNTGGGRDTWKRPEMGKIAEQYCDTVILTNEDPYDENPEKIVEDIAKGMNKKPLIIMDRRSAIREALSKAKEDDVVLITGKGTDPFIMGPSGTKEVWSDASVVREELEALRQNN